MAQDQALSKEIFVELLAHLEDDWEGASNDKERDAVLEFASVSIIGFLCGLRGEERMKVDTSGLLKYIETGAQDWEHPHVVVTLNWAIEGRDG